MKPAGDACSSCPSRAAKWVRPEPAHVNGRVALAVVGEAPSRSEIEDGAPFRGGPGRMLLRGLRTLGLQRHEVHWTKAILCETRSRDLAEARKCCAERLRLELATAAPRAILAAGGIALQSVMGRGKKTPILRWRGSVIPVTLGDVTPSDGAAREAPTGSHAGLLPPPLKHGGVTPSSEAFVLPTIHPAFAMRARAWAPVLERDVARLGRILEHGWIPPELAPQRKTIIARSEEDLESALALMSPSASAFDVETVGLGPTQTALVCFGISDGTTTCIVPWSRASNGLEPYWDHPDAIAERVSEFWRERVVVTHNGPAFDHVVAARYGLKIDQWDDTLIMAHSYRSELPKNLAFCVTQHLDVGPWKEFSDRGADIERLMSYNARDVLYTALVYLAMKEEMRNA